jgi:hypothetical protein
METNAIKVAPPKFQVACLVQQLQKVTEELQEARRQAAQKEQQYEKLRVQEYHEFQRYLQEKDVQLQEALIRIQQNTSHHLQQMRYKDVEWTQQIESLQSKWKQELIAKKEKWHQRTHDEKRQGKARLQARDQWWKQQVEAIGAWWKEKAATNLHNLDAEWQEQHNALLAICHSKQEALKQALHTVQQKQSDMDNMKAFVKQVAMKKYQDFEKDILQAQQKKYLDSLGAVVTDEEILQIFQDARIALTELRAGCLDRKVIVSLFTSMSNSKLAKIFHISRNTVADLRDILGSHPGLKPGLVPEKLRDKKKIRKLVCAKTGRPYPQEAQIAQEYFTRRENSECHGWANCKNGKLTFSWVGKKSICQIWLQYYNDNKVSWVVLF